MEHLREVRDLLQSNPCAHFFSALPLAGLCHDLAKGTSYFQDYLHGISGDSHLKSHALPSAILFLRLCGVGTCTPEETLEKALLFEFIRRHHGALANLTEDLSLDQKEVDQLDKQFNAVDLAGMGRWLGKETSLSFASESIPLRSAWTALRVALKRQLEGEPGEGMSRLQKVLAAFGALIDADRDSAARVANLPAPGLKFTSNRLDHYRQKAGAGKSPMAPARTLVFERARERGSAERWNRGRLWSLTVPTGAGKTLAAVGWALGLRERKQAALGRAVPIVYALPFTSIIDQNSFVLASICGDDAVREGALAIHHHLADYGDLGMREDKWSPRSWAEAWKAEVVSTTFVQVFNALFHGRASDARRFSRLCGGILVLDEVQGIPAHLWPVTRFALTTLASDLSADVLLVTATQPAIFSGGHVEEIAPTDRGFAQPFDRYDLAIEPKPTDLDSFADSLRAAIRVEPSATFLVILNTIREALRLHRSLAQDAGLQGRLFHLSTNLRPKDRRRILELLARRAEAPPILISTQVVEAGVDLSFDRVFRATGPIDSIVQAAGRCNRHGTGPRGRVTVISLGGNSAARIYGPTLIGATEEVLASVSGLVREPDLGLMVGEYFGKVGKRVSTDRAAKILHSVQSLEFAALRGDDSDRPQSAVLLIEKDNIGIPHFVEIEEDDRTVWNDLQQALKISDARQRRTRLRHARSQVAQRVVEVPKSEAAGEPAEETGMVYVPATEASRLYDRETGWLRHF